MVGVFRRSLSFPNKNPNRSSQKPPISHHTRSISLPCRSHPLISMIKDEINNITSWSTSTASTSKPNDLTSTLLCDGLTQLRNVHDLFSDILQLPQARESLHRLQNQWVEKLLDVFLRFVDIYGIFQTYILSLKEDHSAAQMAMRKRDEAKLALYVKSKKKMGSEMTKLLSSVRCIRRSCTILPALTATDQITVPVNVGDAELAGVIGDVIDVTVSVSIALLNGITVAFSCTRPSWIELVKLSRNVRKTNKVDKAKGIKEFQQVSTQTLLECRKIGDEEVRLVLQSMLDMESCICSIEGCSERVFRALINSRVSLLNTLTQ